MRPDIVGYFDDPEQTTPAYDPGPEGLCPICCHPVGRHSEDNPLVTISLAHQSMTHRHRSYFFRAHKNCWSHTTPQEQELIESSIIDAW